MAAFRSLWVLLHFSAPRSSSIHCAYFLRSLRDALAALAYCLAHKPPRRNAEPAGKSQRLQPPPRPRYRKLSEPVPLNPVRPNTVDVTPFSTLPAPLYYADELRAGGRDGPQHFGQRPGATTASPAVHHKLLCFRVQRGNPFGHGPQTGGEVVPVAPANRWPRNGKLNLAAPCFDGVEKVFQVVFDTARGARQFFQLVVMPSNELF